MGDLFQQLEDIVEATKADFEAFHHKGNNAAGTRVRKAMQDIKNIAQAIRVEVQEIKNAE